MECSLKRLGRLLLLLVFFLEGQSHPRNLSSRKSKQFILPLVVWPYYHHPLGTFIFPQSQYSFQPYYQYHAQAQPQHQPPNHYQPSQNHHQNPITNRKEDDDSPDTYQPFFNNRDIPAVVSVHSALSDLSRQEEEKVAVMPVIDHASETTTRPSTESTKVVVPCTTTNRQVGTCKKFSECFPMFAVEYGNGEEHEIFQDSPLAEQLMHNTNNSICAQGGSYDKVDQAVIEVEVCCPKEMFKADYRVERLQKDASGIAENRDVVLPIITQRPPLRSVVVRQLKLTCGQSKAARPKSGKGGGDGISIPRITGGVEATGPKEFPWMAAVFGKNGRIFCGASLITDTFLLSAAHCFSTFTPSDIQKLTVHLGDYNIRTTFDGPHEVRKIEKIIINKGFKIQNYQNDIALLKLNKPVNFTERIQPICLPEPTADSLEKQQVVVTGWGRKFRYGVTSDVLRKVEMPVWNFGECKRVYDTFAPNRLRDTNICAGDGKRDKDACLGDSGGPAIFHDGRKWVQVGITSWGKGCGSFPGVYTRVDKYLMWITKNLEQFQ